MRERIRDHVALSRDAVGTIAAPDGFGIATGPILTLFTFRSHDAAATAGCAIPSNARAGSTGARTAPCGGGGVIRVRIGPRARAGAGDDDVDDVMTFPNERAARLDGLSGRHHRTGTAPRCQGSVVSARFAEYPDCGRNDFALRQGSLDPDHPMLPGIRDFNALRDARVLPVETMSRCGGHRQMCMTKRCLTSVLSPRPVTRACCLRDDSAPDDRSD